MTAEKRISKLAAAEKYRDAEKAQLTLGRYLGDNRATMNALFCKAADAGGFVDAFHRLHQKMQDASPVWTNKQTGESG